MLPSRPRLGRHKGFTGGLNFFSPITFNKLRFLFVLSWKLVTSTNKLRPTIGRCSRPGHLPQSGQLSMVTAACVSGSQQGANLSPPPFPLLLRLSPIHSTALLHLGRRRCVDKRPTQEKRVNLKVEPAGFVVMRNSHAG